MFPFGRFSGEGSLPFRVERSARHALSLVAGLFRGAEGKPERQAMLSMIREVLAAAGAREAAGREALRQMLSRDFSPSEVEKIVAEMRSSAKLTPEEAAERIAPLPEEERERLLQSLIALAAASEVLDSCRAMLTAFAEGIGFPKEFFDKLTSEAEAEHRRRQRFLRSGAGILVALIVIAVFILTATLLKSVIFGLIAAYVFLPVEKFFERRLRAGRGLGHCFFRFTGWLSSPLHRLARSIRKRSGTEVVLTPEESKRRAEGVIIKQAVFETTALVTVILLMLIMLFSSLTNHYVHSLGSSVKSWTARNITSPAPAAATTATETPPAEAEEAPLPPEDVPTTTADRVEYLFEQLNVYLEHLRIRFENLPLVKFGLDEIAHLLQNEEAKRELVTLFLKQTGGIVSFTTSILGMVIAVLADLLLTVFFFLLFLLKLAEFCGPGNRSERQSEYLVRTVFNGSWLPNAGEETVAEAKRIIGGVISRLRTWVRGYLLLMMTDATVYTIAFYFLGVPYFPILGAVAGCGILLPYIGPVLSAGLTLLVTLAVGGSDATALQLVGIVVIYLLYNGVIEQFILYPAVIGESLGLTTLETIIIVLLGAIFAGITGMILALPAASVIKYLVPQIYNCFNPARSKNGPPPSAG